MRGVSDLKGVGDIRTALSAHLRSTSRQKGTPYQEIFAFGMEKLRLEREMEVIGRRLERTRRRLDEANEVIASRIGYIRQEARPDPPSAGETEQGRPAAGGRWRTMTVRY